MYGWFAFVPGEETVLCRSCGADVTAAIPLSAWRTALGPSVPFLDPMPPVTAGKPSPDIGLLLELNAERRAIAEMLEAENRRLAQEAAPRCQGDLTDYAAIARAGAYASAAVMVRARIVAIPAEAETK